jgi:pyruvate,orthophosphate dikinase
MSTDAANVNADSMRGHWVVRLDGTRELSREVVGGKAWSVNRMRAMGIPTPPAVVMTIEVCRAYQDGGRLPAQAWQQLVDEIQTLETATGRVFGGSGRPLLVSVRSGAARSMPGMMDTILNLGFSDAVESALARESGDATFAADTRRRFEHEFRATVLGNAAADLPADPIEQLRLAVLELDARARVSRLPPCPRRRWYRRNCPGHGVR